MGVYHIKVLYIMEEPWKHAFKSILNLFFIKPHLLIIPNTLLKTKEQLLGVIFLNYILVTNQIHLVNIL